MSLNILRRMALQQSRTLYKIGPRNYSSISKTDKNPGKKPTKPPSVFALYFEDHSEEHRANNPYIKQNELIRLVGENWKSAPEDHKKAYREKFMSLVEQYKQHLIDFENGLNDDQQVIQALRDERDEKASEIGEQRVSAAMGFPKRPTTAFGHFIKAAREAVPRDQSQSLAEWNDQMADKWRAMSEEEKQSFRKASKQSYQKFEVEKDDWKSTFSVDEVGGFQR